MHPDTPSVLVDLRADLSAQVDLPFRSGALAFFKEPINPLGVRAAGVRGCAARVWTRVRTWDRDRLLDLCGELWATGVFEEGSVAAILLDRAARGSRPPDFDRFEGWLAAHVANWAHCDLFCTHAFGRLLTLFPELQPRIGPWTRSANRWERRAAAVILIPLVHGGQGLDLALATAEALLADPDDLVRKGTGWLLKEASRRFRDQVHTFVMDRRGRMPRTILRYALERMPPDLRRQAMARP